MHDEADSDENLAVRVAAAPVRDLGGQPVRLRDLWGSQPSVNAFVRHFGCIFCHQMVADLVAAAPQIQSLGAQVFIVGNGSVNQARHFAEDKGFSRGGLVLVTDPERASYQAFDLQRGFVKTFGTSGARRAYGDAHGEGHRITGWFGDLTQLGGVLVVKPPATVLYRHRSRFAGDHPDMAEVLRAVRGAFGAVTRAAKPG